MLPIAVTPAAGCNECAIPAAAPAGHLQCWFELPRTSTPSAGVLAESPCALTSKAGLRRDRELTGTFAGPTLALVLTRPVATRAVEHPLARPVAAEAGPVAVDRADEILEGRARPVPIAPRGIITQAGYHSP